MSSSFQSFVRKLSCKNSITFLGYLGRVLMIRSRTGLLSWVKVVLSLFPAAINLLFFLRYLSKSLPVIPDWKCIERKRIIILSGSCLANSWSVNVADTWHLNIETFCIHQEMQKISDVLFFYDAVAVNYLKPFYIYILVCPVKHLTLVILRKIRKLEKKVAHIILC